MRKTYLGLCILGFAAPYAVFLPWALEHGFDPALFVEHALANPFSTFIVADIAVSAVVVIFVAAQGLRRGDMRMVWPIVGTLTVGVSLGLPLYWYLAHGETTGRSVTAPA